MHHLPSSRLLLSAYPCRLPHVGIDGGELFFGRRKDDLAGDAEREFLELADGRTSFGEILGRRPHLMMAAGMSRHAVWLSASLEPGPAAAGPLCLLLGAHPGDVELSMAGLILRRGRRGLRGEEAARFVHLCCFSRQIETQVPDAFGSPLELTAIRRDESHLADAVLGIETRYLDLPEYVLRQTHEDRARLILPPDEMEAALRIALHEILAELAPEQVYAPAAVGDHPDQRMIFDAVLELYEQESFPGVSYHLYENFPLSASYLNVDGFLSRFEGSYLGLDPWFEEVGGILAEKLTLAEIFRSRLDLACRPLLFEVAARNARLARLADGAGSERFWTLRDAALYA
jgi:LmbE family N-acetylglucosaminyl deacetylase